MTTLTRTGTVVAHTTLVQTRKRSMLAVLAMIAVIIGVASVLLQSFLTGNRFGVVDIEVLRILSAVFVPSIVGLLLAFIGSVLPDDGRQ